ncbi:MAG: hypothetical protein LBQ59_03755 [Candidatus Peribacteria bacterium]|jgi:hypothetical protein|nr:hypothetical protein [Candidatus Peribacteria bacterium]
MKNAGVDTIPQEAIDNAVKYLKESLKSSSLLSSVSHDNNRAETYWALQTA